MRLESIVGSAWCYSCAFALKAELVSNADSDSTDFSIANQKANEDCRRVLSFRPLEPLNPAFQIVSKQCKRLVMRYHMNIQNKISFRNIETRFSKFNYFRFFVFLTFVWNAMYSGVRMASQCSTCRGLL